MTPTDSPPTTVITTTTSTPRPAPTAGCPRPTETQALGDAIAELSARIQAATYELLVLIHQFDERGGWGPGCASCAHWLSWRTGLALGAAREKVRVARALAGLPRLSAAMRRGAVSYSKVRAITRVATPDTEERLLEFALAGTAAHVERVVRAWRRADRLAEAEEDRRQRTGRYLETYVDDDGMLVVRARLTPEAGAVLQRALEAAEDRLYREAADAGAEGGAGGRAEPETTNGQRRADALGLVAESALAADLASGSAGGRYQVVVHVDAEALHQGSDAGQSALDDGVRVSAETSRRLACDASIVFMGLRPKPHAALVGPRRPTPRRGARRARPAGALFRRLLGVITNAPDGAVLDVGRKTRTIPPAIRRALQARDRRCRFPGCQSRHCDAHHLRHWADGGATRLDNLVLLCRRHHRAVHEEGFSIVLREDGGVRVTNPSGWPLVDAPPAPPWTGPALGPIAARLEADSIEIHRDTATPSWQGEPLDLGFTMSLLYPTAGPRPDDVPAGTSS